MREQIEKLISEYKKSVIQLYHPPKKIPPSIRDKWENEAGMLELVIEDLENIMGTFEESSIATKEQL